jgi:orotate phosphoribosyltransferase
VKAQGNVEILGLMVSLNRMEKGKNENKSALEEIQELYGFKTAAIVSMDEVVERLYNKECLGRIVIDDAIKSSIDKYYDCYGVK